MANVSRPVDLFNPTTFNANKSTTPVTADSSKKVAKKIKPKKKTVQKAPKKAAIKESNKKKLLPWM